MSILFLASQKKIPNCFEKQNKLNHKELMTHLGGGPLNISNLREWYKQQLVDILDKAPSPKMIVWDTRMMAPVGQITEYSFLKSHGVDKMVSLSDTGSIPPAPLAINSVFFIIPGDLTLMESVSAYVQQEIKRAKVNRKEFQIIFVPRKSLVCEQFLNEKDLLKVFNGIHEFCLDVIPLDNDLLSMELPDLYADAVLREDHSDLFQLSRSLMTLQFIYGPVTRIQGKGSLAQKLFNMVNRMREESDLAENRTVSKIDNMIFIDRHVDPLTPLLNQLTYEGLIDEMFGIKYNQCSIPKAILEDVASGSGSSSTMPAEDAPRENVILHSGDQLYGEIRDKNFAHVGIVLHRRVKEVTTQRMEVKEARTVQDLKKVVTNLPHLQERAASISKHMAIAEALRTHTYSEEFMDCLRCQQDFLGNVEADKAHPYIEDCICREEDVFKVLRLIVIQSYCTNGLKTKLYEYYKREIIQVYGLHYIFFWENLKKLGLIQCQTSTVAASVYRSPYSILNKSLRLYVTDNPPIPDTGNPTDMSDLFSGYAPISGRLVQYLAQPGWKAFSEALNLLPGPEFDHVYYDNSANAAYSRSTGDIGSNLPSQRKITLVVFIGGITFSEIAALRFLSQMEDAPVSYVILTTGIINHESFMKSIDERVKLAPLHLNV